jgi:hypothetical protein
LVKLQLKAIIKGDRYGDKPEAEMFIKDAVKQLFASPKKPIKY